MTYLTNTCSLRLHVNTYVRTWYMGTRGTYVHGTWAREVRMYVVHGHERYVCTWYMGMRGTYVCGTWA